MNKERDLYLVCDGGWFEKDDNDSDVVIIVKRKLWGKNADYGVIPMLEKNAKEKQLLGPMYDGRFIYTSDGRFPYDHPLALHDRYEMQEEYDMYSR